MACDQCPEAGDIYMGCCYADLSAPLEFVMPSLGDIMWNPGLTGMEYPGNGLSPTRKLIDGSGSENEHGTNFNKGKVGMIFPYLTEDPLGDRGPKTDTRSKHRIDSSRRAGFTNDMPCLVRKNGFLPIAFPGPTKFVCQQNP